MTSTASRPDGPNTEGRLADDDDLIIEHITRKTAHLAQQWNVFMYFFCERLERVEVLNAASEQITLLLRDLLWDSTLLRIRQLTDPAKTRNNHNLSLEHLVRIARASEKGDLTECHRSAMEACAPAKAYADKYLAHLDFDHTIGVKQTAIARGQTTQAVKAICDFVRVFHLTVRDVDVHLLPVGSTGDEKQFLLRLYQGNGAEAAVRDDLKAAAAAGDWRGARRTDIPEWILGDPQGRDFLDPS